jgi:hypothetical protein
MLTDKQKIKRLEKLVKDLVKVDHEVSKMYLGASKRVISLAEMFRRHLEQCPQYETNEP